MNGLSFLKMEKKSNLVSFGGPVAYLDTRMCPQTTLKRRPYSTTFRTRETSYDTADEVSTEFHTRFRVLSSFRYWDDT
jgi:hypothetical protein